VLIERGVAEYERSTVVMRDDLKKIGIEIDVLPLDRTALDERLATCDYEAVYDRAPAAGLDPASAMNMWLSTGSAHVWHPSQKAPDTEWERRMDTLMLEQIATIDPQRRRDQFNLVQRIFAENLPMLYFAAPRLYYAHSSRVSGLTPSVVWPYVLWNADTISVSSK
jgi:peptide/nickel transport system substrate-binding protein